MEMKKNNKEKSNSNGPEIYLLLKDTETISLKLKRNLRSSGNLNGPWRALRGSLIRRSDKESNDVAVDGTYISMDDSTQCFKVHQDHLTALTNKQFKILYAIQAKIDRFILYNDNGLFQKLTNLKVDDKVKVKMDNGQEVSGTVKNIGPTVDNKGTNFVIELKVCNYCLKARGCFLKIYIFRGGVYKREGFIEFSTFFEHSF